MTVLTAKGKVGASSIWRKRRGRTIELKVVPDYLLCDASLEADNSFAIPVVAHGGSNESSYLAVKQGLSRV